MTHEEVAELARKIELLKPVCEKCGKKLQHWHRPYLCPDCWFERECRFAAYEDEYDDR